MQKLPITPAIPMNVLFHAGMIPLDRIKLFCEFVEDSKSMPVLKMAAYNYQGDRLSLGFTVDPSTLLEHEFIFDHSSLQNISALKQIDGVKITDFVLSSNCLETPPHYWRKWLEIAARKNSPLSVHLRFPVLFNGVSLLPDLKAKLKLISIDTPLNFSEPGTKWSLDFLKSYAKLLSIHSIRNEDIPSLCKRNWGEIKAVCIRNMEVEPLCNFLHTVTDLWSQRPTGRGYFSKLSILMEYVPNVNLLKLPVEDLGMKLYTSMSELHTRCICYYFTDLVHNAKGEIYMHLIEVAGLERIFVDINYSEGETHVPRTSNKHIAMLIGP